MSTNEDLTSNTFRYGRFSFFYPSMPEKTNDAPRIRRFKRLPYLVPNMDIHRLNYHPRPHPWGCRIPMYHEIVVGAQRNLYIEVDDYQ